MTFARFFFVIITFISHLITVPVHGLGSGATVAVTYGIATVCGISAGKLIQNIQCYRTGLGVVPVLANASFDAISGGQSFFCGLRSGGLSLLCWDAGNSNSTFRPKRLYYSRTVRLTDLTVGDSQVCAREVGSGRTKCWRGGYRGGSDPFPSPGPALKFQSITSGSGFACGILMNNNRVLCWGHNAIAGEIQAQFGNLPMSSLVAGESHACGLTSTGILVCKGDNSSGQLSVPSRFPHEFSGLALGRDFTCAIRQNNGLAVCWGGTQRFKFESSLISNASSSSFELITAGLNFVCGLTTSNLTVICWGPGWSNETYSQDIASLGTIAPGPCVEGSCGNCGIYPNSGSLCGGSGSICKPCQMELPIAVPLPPHAAHPPQGLPALSPPKVLNKLSVAFLTVGSIGAFAGICSIGYCLWTGSFLGFSCNRVEELYDQPNTASNLQPSRSLPRSISGSSASKQTTDKTERFTLSELALATNNFSPENRIGSGSFGVVYRGKFADGREVAIKRGEISNKMAKKLKEKESAFESELALLSRLNHKHLVGLIGFCQEKDERLLVYEYMSNGALHDHLHNTEQSRSSILNSWKMRIKIVLDAARGIEYLHNYAVPPIIHRDIKSSNILLDANWTARVSDFGLSLIRPESETEQMPSRAVGTVGYIDPEYYVLNVLTAKSDIYSFGIVLLEVLTGRRAVFKDEEGKGPVGVVEFAVPRISAGELYSVLDRRVRRPEMNEGEAVEMVAYIAMQCVNLEGNGRPSITDIVVTLERALALCYNNTISFASE